MAARTAVSHRRLGSSEPEVWARMAPRERSWTLLATGVALVAVAAAEPTLARAAVGLLGLAIFVVVAISSRPLAVALIFVWLPMLGFVRRLLIPFAGWSTNDPLLLVGPAAAVIILVASRDEKPPVPTLVSTAGALLLGWSAIQVFNPNEPDLNIAFQSTLFYVGPLLWLFVGRRLGRAEHERVLDVLFWVGVPVVAHGLNQSFFGLLNFELTWVGVSEQSTAIFLEGFRIRPFSTLVSPQEYGFFVSFVMVLVWTRILYRRGPALWLWAYLAVGTLALFLQGTRTVFLLFMIAVLVVTVARFRSMLALVSAMGLAGLLVLWAASTSAADDPVTTDAEGEAVGGASASAAFEHQLTGLLDPSSTTAPEHIRRIQEGFRTGIENPFGTGASFGTIAGERLAQREGERFVTAENDFGNVLGGLGIPGGLGLGILIVGGLLGARRLHRARPGPLHLAWLGILVASLTQWLSAGLYATSSLVFLILGGVTVARTWADADPPVGERERALGSSTA